MTHDLNDMLNRAVDAVQAWQAEAGPFTAHPSVDVDPTRLTDAVAQLTDRLRDNYPFHHPRYAGQMLKPPHPAAVMGYVAAMLINPNNHALDGGPATGRMEKEVVADLAGMVGFTDHLGHLTSSGTIANLEALYVARETHPGRAIAYSADAHYTHARMCRVLGVEGVEVPATDVGHLDLDALSDLLASGRVGTVVATMGTTGLGAVDPLQDIVPLAREHGVRVHADAAYGGFFRLLADTGEVASAPWQALSSVDSIVIDPHKHGLQPYGCGAVLFADPEVGRHYVHDSPYTYFTSEELHLGEISLECSRAGASAAALWLTLQVFPLTREGLGAVLAAGRRAALEWYRLLTESQVAEPFVVPETDIVTLLPRAATASEVDAMSARALHEGMGGDDPVYLSTLRVDAERLARLHPGVRPDTAQARILRSVLMKPESEDAVGWLHDRVTTLLTP